MSNITVKVEFDQKAGTVKFSLDLQGTTELDHELLAATIATGRAVKLVPAHMGNELFAEFTIADLSIWPRAARAMENRKRVADGLPTIEEEEAQAAMRAASEQDDKVRSEAAHQKAEEEAQAKQDAADQHIAKVASEAAAETFARLSAANSPAPEPATPSASKENVASALDNLSTAAEHD